MDGSRLFAIITVFIGFIVVATVVVPIFVVLAILMYAVTYLRKPEDY